MISTIFGSHIIIKIKPMGKKKSIFEDQLIKFEMCVYYIYLYFL